MAITRIGSNYNVYESTYIAQKNEAAKKAETKETATQTGVTANIENEKVSDYYSYLSQINSSSVQAQLKAAGIDTNSKQYKAALSEMMKNGNGAMFTNVQAIKNLMSQYDKNGDWVDPNTGLSNINIFGKPVDQVETLR